jgi:hypothetical protein
MRGTVPRSVKEKAMQNKVIGVVLGFAGSLLWFAPWANVHFMNMAAVQSGADAGGTCTVVLLASIAYAVLSWREQHALRIVAAGVALGIGALAAVQVGGAAAWGLYGTIVVAAASAALAVKDLRVVSALSVKRSGARA